MDPVPPLLNPTAAIDAGTDHDLPDRDAWFTASPDPWTEIVRLEHGADRSFASAVQQMVANAEPAQRPVLEGLLVNALNQPKIADAGRQFICRMLAWIGSTACVPTLARLLNDERTADDARLALDALDDPAINEIYRDVLGRLRGRAKIGLMGSIANRGDGDAIDALTAIAIDEAEAKAVRIAAERAVEHLVALSRS